MDLELPTTAAALGQWFDASIIGDPAASVVALSPLEKAGEGSLSFCNNPKFGQLLGTLRGAVLFTRKELVQADLPLTYIVVENPQAAFAEVARRYSRANAQAAEVSPHAVVHSTARIGERVSVGAFAVIEAGADIGDDSVVGAHSFVGSDVRLGKECQLYPRVTLLERVILGDRVKIFPGTVVGSDGFGMVQDAGANAEMPQMGTVVIEDDVRIGANCTIDRGTFGETRIGQGTKLDDQVHVAHNTTIGQNCIMCGQSGTAGSVVLEDNVMMGGQVGIKDHLRVGKGARIGGQSGVTKDLEGGRDYFSTPAAPIGQAMRIIACVEDLPNMARRLRQVEIKLEKKD